jgi:hypothetical protein
VAGALLIGSLVPFDWARENGIIAKVQVTNTVPGFQQFPFTFPCVEAVVSVLVTRSPEFFQEAKVFVVGFYYKIVIGIFC